MWQTIWPERPQEQVPIFPITNGVHARTWLASHMKNLFDTYLGQEWRYKLLEKEFWNSIDSIPDEKLCAVRRQIKQSLIKSVRKRLINQRERNGESRESLDEAENILDSDTLTIGFARRFAPYKRATLLFRDRERLKSILGRDSQKVQIIFAGKAHPANQEGQMLIQQVYAESRNPEFAGKIIFVENYDMSFARRLVAGVDVWLNTPRRPFEASGTSGMKAAMNGALNLSILDGWWPEAYNGKNGWAIGSERIYYNDMEQDEADSLSLYSLLEDKVIPLFYQRDSQGIPKEWIAMMKESMRTIFPQFNTYRMLEEYMRKMYLPSIEGQK
jgi:starch phosphorylase